MLLVGHRTEESLWTGVVDRVVTKDELIPSGDIIADILGKYGGRTFVPHWIWWSVRRKGDIILSNFWGNSIRSAKAVPVPVWPMIYLCVAA